jgi:hypothetical protein
MTEKKMKREDIFDKLHDAVATTLLDKIQSGDANASDLNVARQFLRDNGIAGIPQENSPLKNLMDELPFTEEEVEKKINGNTSSS